MENQLSQRQINIPGNINSIGPLSNTADAPSVFARTISATIGVLTLVAAIWFLFVLITGAISIISSGGDKGTYESARKRIVMGLVGFVVVIAGIFIFDLVATLLGIPGILNVGAIINTLTP